MWLAEKSISDDYFNFVSECVNNKNISNFKSDYRYNRIVGMSNKSQFVVWDDFFKDISIDNIDELKKNDISIAPEIYNSKKFGNISSSTLRYIYTAYDIKTKFKKLNSVVEIGIGYGGLCYILSNFIDIKEYKFVDVDIVKEFASLYLDSLDIKNYKIDHDGISDLLISEFCFSEFDDDMMKKFYDDYITKTNSIYLVMNLHDETRKQYWKTLLSNDFDLKEIDEFPKTQWPNYVWFGNRK